MKTYSFIAKLRRVAGNSIGITVPHGLKERLVEGESYQIHIDVETESDE